MFVEDLTQFFDVEGGFAVDVTFKRGSTVLAETVAIFNDATQSVEIYDSNVEEPSPFLLAQTAAITGVKREDQAVIGETTYRVVIVHHDGTGVSTVRLGK